MKKKKQLILNNQKGQGIMEYVILTGLIGIFCLAAIRGIGKSLETRADNIREQIQSIKIN